MSELLVLEFDGVDETHYEKVNAELGLDPETGSGQWPTGLVSHLAGLTEAGRAYVVEVWESQQAQEDFMRSRLGTAMPAGGVSPPASVTWARLIGQHHPGL